jgi:hypothetical protein
MNINSYKKRREEVGSSFHRVDDMGLEKVDINFDYDTFYSGRQAFKYILDKVYTNKNIHKI